MITPRGQYGGWRLFTSSFGGVNVCRIKWDNCGEAEESLNHFYLTLSRVKHKGHRTILQLLWFHSSLPVTAVFTLPLMGEQSIVMSVSVCLCVYVCLSAIISSELHVWSSASFLCMYLWLWLSDSDTLYTFSLLMTSCLLISQGCSMSLLSWSAVHMQPWARL